MIQAWNRGKEERRTGRETVGKLLSVEDLEKIWRHAAWIRKGYGRVKRRKENE